MSSTLANPFNFISGIATKNRIVLAPMTNMQSPSDKLSEAEFAWLAARIDGNFGIVTTCATHVSKSAQAWSGQMGIYSDAHMAGLKKISNKAKSQNALAIPQIFHGGFRCPQNLTGLQPVSCSEIRIDTPEFEVPRALSETEIIQIQRSFVDAAERAISAGLPGVEIHGANGYLFTQFLSSHTNTRTDKWGGSLKNRSRFLLEVVKKVRDKVGSRKIVGVRLSPEDTKIISSIDIDEMKEVALWLEEIGIDYLSLSLWDAFKKPNKYSDRKKSIVEIFRNTLSPKTAIIASGKIWTLEDAHRSLSDGADLVAIGSAAIGNPNWPELIVNSEFKVKRFPLTKAQLNEVEVSDLFVEYLKKWGFVAKENII